MKDFKLKPRPRVKRTGCLASDGHAAASAQLLGGKTVGGTVLTRDQEQALVRLYGFDPERDKGVEGADLLAAGAFRNMTRQAQSDGLRLVAYLARHMEPGEDPVCFVKRMMSDVGYDVQLEMRDFEDEDQYDLGGDDGDQAVESLRAGV